MYNFKSYGRTFKGLAGECFFQLTRSNSCLTRFYPLGYVLRKYSSRLSSDQINFISNNWLTFDSIEFGDDIIIYEIKTRNIENQMAGYRLKITKNCVDIYTMAEQLGFKVKVATVLLHDNWNYSVVFDNFSDIKTKCWIYDNNKYDKSVGYGRVLEK